MTRFLSESLQATEPFFRLGIKRLEAANGSPNTDIRFSTEVLHGSHAKLRELGLDPHDTTLRELYQALQQRMAEDDAILKRTLQTNAALHVSAEADVVAGMVHVIAQLPDSRRCFAIKNSKLKAIIKQQPPKKAMKRLGYRSVDSLIKHEAPALILAAAWLSEGESWQKRLIDSYRKLQPGDFESRSIQLLHPNSKRWQALTAEVVASKKHNLLSFKELGALVFLPLPQDIPAGLTTASFSLALHELNEIRATSTFLKFSQVRVDFGKVVQTIALDEAQLNSQLLDKPVPWHLVQRYYARVTDRFREDIFEPHLEQADMVWHNVEETLAKLEPRLAFWRNTAHLGVVKDRQPISLNIVDAALNYCNQLGFEQRAVSYFQQSLWHELLLRYLRHEPVERAVLAELQPQFATERITA